MWLADFFHQFPRLNFAFDPVSAVCDFTNKDYVEGLIIWATLPIVVSIALFVIIVGVLTVKCCSKGNGSKPNTEAKAVASGLSICLIVGIIFVSTALYCNDHIAKSIAMAVDGVDDLSNAVANFGEKVQAFNHSINSQLLPAINSLMIAFPDTAAGSVQKYGVQLENFMNSTYTDLSGIISFGTDLTTLEQGRELLRRMESERWILFLLLFAIILTVNFGGLIAACRMSSKGMTLFSGVGLFTYLIGWAQVSLIFALALCVSDFCKDPYPLMNGFMQTDYSRAMLLHFKKCMENQPVNAYDAPGASCLKSLVAVNEMVTDVIIDSKDSIDGDTLRAASLKISDAFMETLQHAVTLKNMASCETVRGEYKTIKTGLCYDSLTGIAVMLVAMLAYVLVHFVTMLIASGAWRVFQRRINTYADSDGNDPLLSRNDAATVHADFYGSHVFNPRSRLAASVESCNGENSVAGFRNTPPPAYEYGITSLRMR